MFIILFMVYHITLYHSCQLWNTVLIQMCLYANHWYQKWWRRPWLLLNWIFGWIPIEIEYSLFILIICYFLFGWIPFLLTYCWAVSWAVSLAIYWVMSWAISGAVSWAIYWVIYEGPNTTKWPPILKRTRVKRLRLIFTFTRIGPIRAKQLFLRDLFWVQP